MVEKKVVLEQDPVTDEEKAWMQELRDIHGSNVMRSNLSDLDLLRFVRAYVNDENRKEKTFKVVADYVEWYIANKINEIAVADFENYEKYQKMWPSGLKGITKEGWVVYKDEIGLMVPKEFSKEFTTEQYKGFHIQLMEHLQLTKRELSTKLDKNIYKHIVILNLDGFGFSHIWDRAFLEEMSALDSLRYPETLHKMYIINAGFFFKAIWAMCSAFLDPTTQARIQVLKDPKELDKLIDYSDDSEDVLKDLKVKYAAAYANNLALAEAWDLEHPKPAAEEDAAAATTTTTTGDEAKKDETTPIADEEKKAEDKVVEEKKEEAKPE